MREAATVDAPALCQGGATGADLSSEGEQSVAHPAAASPRLARISGLAIPLLHRRSMPAFNVVVFSSTEPRDIVRLVRRIHREVPGARVAGVLYEKRPGKPLGRRMRDLAKNLRDADFRRYFAARIGAAVRARRQALGDAVLAFVHAARPVHAAEEDLDTACAALGCRVLVTQDCHGPEALAFVRSLEPDLGVVYGTRILKRSLFAIPRLGSINIHKRKVPDYRGGGPVGLWELLDGAAEIGVTVHEVVEALDAGAIIHAETIPIQPYDTLTSLALKAHVVGNDLLVRAVADHARGTVEPKPQRGEGRMFRAPSPPRLLTLERELAARRPAFPVVRSRPVAKLLLRTIVGLPIAAVRNRIRRRRGRYPVMILFHHLVTDRPHDFAISTEHFLKHVRFLKRHYDVVTLAGARAMLKANRVTAPTVVLTLDDGYADNVLTLRAIREHVDVPLTLFVCTEHVTKGTEFTHDVEAGRRGFPPLTWAQLAQLRREGFEIGSHTRSHFDCGATDLVALRDEIVGSQQDLEAELGEPATLFAFPFGLRANISREAMRLATGHYACVMSAYGGSNFATPEVKHLRRWPYRNDLWELELQLQSLLELEPRADAAR
jgi:peptidoglycan/xylan/chitin deacetylase (PgdA/CDA1 family)/folate-dependent phosphoribosylglycinamide formyltransferase PurN